MNCLKIAAKKSALTSITQARRSRVLQSRIQPMLSSALPLDHDTNRNSTEMTSWQPHKNVDIQRVTQTAIIHEITHQQSQTIAKVVPWFLSNMPSSYFNTVPEQFRLDHIKAVSAIQDANLDIHMNLKTHLPDGRLVLTYIRPGKAAGKILNLVKHLPWNHNEQDYLPLSRVQVFASEDETMSISMFVFGEELGSYGESKPPKELEHIGCRILNYATRLQAGEFLEDERAPNPNSIFERQELVSYFEVCPETYIMRSDPRRFLKQRELYEKVSGTECMAISVEESVHGNAAGDFWIDIAVANSLPQVALENACMVLSQHNFDIVRSHLDILSDGDNGDVTMLRLLVSPDISDGDCHSTTTKDTFRQIVRELKRTKWMDPQCMELAFQKYPWLGVTRAELITGFCHILHPVMAKNNPFAFSLGNIYEMITKERYIQHASAIANLFLDRFYPFQALGDDEFEEKRVEIISKISTDVEDTVAKDLLLKMVDIVSHTLKTNIYLENRYALGLRLDPKVIHASEEDSGKVPYGIIFCHGRRFNAFHVRFKDVARGGMRLVTPPNEEAHALESARLYDECYGLAFAQQLKNKDIPEGGSKAVNLINCNDLSVTAKQFVMRKSVKAFTNTIFDLIVETEETRERVVDRLGKSEVLYLGPDEQVTVEDINWIVKRAGKRGYAIPNAFMSSKPKTGINHKEFGVTSEGVNTYLDVALRKVLSINPDNQKFTVKITGGPDGDVAGNEIKILLREYGENAVIVGIADGSGCAEDPDGLNHEELLRLVNNTLSISEFDATKLGPEGQKHLVHNEEGIKARNSMHNRLVSDAFIPAGGRPSTIDMSNYKNFLLSDGKPSSPLIVEGANLFITDSARRALYDDAGVVIVKDSSANKCGVITSSYEICSAMMLSEDDFYIHKPKIVDEVLSKLRHLARMEAELLFREFEKQPDALPAISQRISNAINLATDAISKKLDDTATEEVETLLPLFKDHLPKTISDLAFDEVHDRVPHQYICNAIASCLASKLVYKEGCDFIERLQKDKLASYAMKYIEKEREIAQLKDAIDSADMGEHERRAIIQILDSGGVRTALNLNLCLANEAVEA